jgi:hypothetical protein
VKAGLVSALPCSCGRDSQDWQRPRRDGDGTADGLAPDEAELVDLGSVELDDLGSVVGAEPVPWARPRAWLELIAWFEPVAWFEPAVDGLSLLGGLPWRGAAAATFEA